MKSSLYLFFSIVTLIFAGCSKGAVNYADLKSKELRADSDSEVMYYKDSETPYTGKVFEEIGNGKIKFEGYYANGMRDSIWTYYNYREGNVENLKHYRDGMLLDTKKGSEINNPKVTIMENGRVSFNDDKGLFIIKQDTIYYFEYSRGSITGMFLNHHIKYEAYNWGYHKYNVLKNIDIDREWAVSYPFATIETSGWETVIFDNNRKKDVLLLGLSVTEQSWGKNKINGIYEYPAFYCDFNNNEVTLKNNFHGKTKKLYNPFREQLSNGIHFRIWKQIEVDGKFGEKETATETIEEDWDKAIILGDLDYICFGSDGLDYFTKEKNIEIYKTIYPFKFQMKKNN